MIGNCGGFISGFGVLDTVTGACTLRLILTGAFIKTFGFTLIARGT